MKSGIKRVAIIATLGCILAETGMTKQLPVDTPEKFCTAHGGMSFKTTNVDVSICCYPQKRRCIGTNSRLSISANVQFPWEISDYGCNPGSECNLREK